MMRYRCAFNRFYTTNNQLFLSKDISKTIPTADLFQKVGFTRQPSSGLVHWLPLGLRMIQRMEALIRTEMNRAGAEEVSLSSLSSDTLWKETGRWGNPELFKLKDARGADFCLVPTCEEEITAIAKAHVGSYKNLPLVLYQITRKYRDEKRPRGGLLRGREFLMKDAYSFDAGETAALETYNRIYGAYKAIFTRLGLPFAIAEADTGDIGGSLSHEWHYLHSSGEDSLFTCTGCGTTSNLEKTRTLSAAGAPAVETAAVSYFVNDVEDTLVAVYYPEGRTLLPLLIREEIPDLKVSGLADASVLESFMADGEIIGKSIIRVMDARLHDRTVLPDFPVPFQRGSFTTLTDIPVVEALEGEVCYACEEGVMERHKAIEVGHTFFLGERYSKPLNATYADGNGKPQLMSMGCYGIGVSRLLAAIAEISRDDQGFVWPACVAPFHVTLIDGPGLAVMETMAVSLEAVGITVNHDHRPKLGVGRKIQDSNVVGIPLVVIAGKAWPRVEIEVRGKRWGKSSWKATFEANRTEWDWLVETVAGREKHVVEGVYVTQVVEALLRDL